MRLKKLMALGLTGILVLSVTACGKNNQTDSKDSAATEPEIVLEIILVNQLVPDGKKPRKLLKKSPVEKWQLKSIRIHSWEINHH